MITRPLLVSAIAGIVAVSGAAEDLPWQREQSLKDAAAAVTIEADLDPQCPQPAGEPIPGRAFLLSNPSMKASLWGPPDRITLSLMKTDVFDRRCAPATPVTLAQIREGAYAPKNAGFDDMPLDQRSPVQGYLLPSGGRVDPYAGWNAYPFPCEKPVGQIILGLDDLAEGASPHIVQNCRDGTVRVQAQTGGAKADLEIILSAERNVIAMRGRLKGVSAPWLRVYRHQDQAQSQYRMADGKWAQNGYDYAKDAAWNGPVDPPTSGTDGRFFWIRQRLPAEKTFPQGFEYVLVGLTPQLHPSKIETAENRRGLGTLPSTGGDATLSTLETSYAAIRGAPGAASTVLLAPGSDDSFTAYLTVVTTNEDADPLAEAERRLLKASSDGFQKLQDENAAWYGRLYDDRESGRVFYGGGGNQVSDDIPAIFRSWYCLQGGACKPDMRRYEAGAPIVCVEQDWQPGHGLPCYDELFSTPDFVRNRADSQDMWWKLVEHWLPAARLNAREVYAMPGMMLAHGYMPPVKPDRYVHTDCALELCIDTPAQVLKVLWDQWDYGGDEAFLKDKVYPALRDLAAFYAAYAKLGADGSYHFIPSMEAEAWGIFPRFARARDSIGALCMARWTLLRAAEAAAILHTDEDSRMKWRSLAAKIAPYPEYFTPNGPVFNSMNGTKPGWRLGDHAWFTGVYPATLADEVTLDSPKPLQAQMIRTVRIAPAPSSAAALVLLGACPGTVASSDEESNVSIDDDRALRAEIERYPERLLNSRSGRIWLFPCVPDWSYVGFRRFQARGGLLVSAVKEGGEIPYIEIEARRDTECRLINPWPGRPVIVRDRETGFTVPLAMDTDNGECLIFSADRGGDYVISRQD